MARALVPASLGWVAHLAAAAVTPLWVAAADIGELLFTRWLCDGPAVAVACGIARLAAWAYRAARGAFGARLSRP